MNKFKKDKYYLLRYSLQSLILFVILDSSLYLLNGVRFHFVITKFDFIFPILAFLFCGLPSSIMHNCAHGNIKPRILNTIVGEICGTVMLYGFRGFALAHLFHHIYPDDPTMDPHPPRGHHFLGFVVSPIKATLQVVERAYYNFFGKSVETDNSIKLQLVLFNLGLLARTVFWFLLLGPKYFVLGFVPIYAANIFVFAHINFAAHIERADGKSEIINLNHNLYYKYINLVSFGGYFHKSHHLKPGAFNPANITINDAEKLITYIPSRSIEKKINKKRKDDLTINSFLDLAGGRK